ncbi:MAG: acetylglutamate kinase [Planctomycetota bacterium]|nr:MAG: acetylglutamate kinase [Planctomycetota bacterium]REJ90278.1 MAG: acetylglutamate kinase [Planctomycetota bacterium]REK17789.1 MAG: acetylglutamate kinase [Planctomycetota bacterium]REK40981.1 MAG: acetylglutamate kinase [Planctomycetota bacterium]
MQEAIEKADVLIEALGWIRRLRDKVTIIKLGGSLLDDLDALHHVLIDIVFMETVGMRPVVVHGGGKAINRALAAEGLESRFEQGRRVTDDATLAVVERVLAYETNEQIATEIERLGGRAMPLNFRSTNVLEGRLLELTDAAGQRVELGRVGEVTRVDRLTIDNLCYAGQVPVIPSMCLDEAGEKLNVNADTAAMAVAESLGAEKLVFLSDINGVRRDIEDSNSLISSLRTDEARQLIAAGSIQSGMIPKVEACLATLDRGVGKIHIIDGRLRHSLLLEIYTNEGVGTEIVSG